VGDRPATPDALVIRGSNENVGPSEEAEAEFARELAKLITDSSSENRKVDKRTANALWDSSSMPSGLKKKRLDNETAESPEQGVMRFTVVSRRGHKQQVGVKIWTSPAY
jgi:regulator of nonsense transcripts 2